MGKNRTSQPVSQSTQTTDNDDAGSVENTLEYLCDANGYELSYDGEGNAHVYDSEFDTEIVLSKTYLETINEYEEMFKSLFDDDNVHFLQDIIQTYHDAPGFLKKSNDLILFDDQLDMGDYTAIHRATSGAHGIVVSPKVLGTNNYTEPIQHVLYHEMAHGLDYCTVDDFGRHYMAHNGSFYTHNSMSLDDIVDTYGSATAYSKDNFGRGFSNSNVKYMEDFAEAMGIVLAYKTNKNFKVTDTNGMNVNVEKWMQNHKEMVDWVNGYIDSQPESYTTPQEKLDMDLITSPVKHVG